MWSIGVITYILLSGRPPFHSTRVSRILHKIVHYPVSFDEDVWNDLSFEAQQFVELALEKNPKERLKPSEGLKHKWIKQIVDNDNIIKPKIIRNLIE